MESINPDLSPGVHPKTQQPILQNYQHDMHRKRIPLAYLITYTCYGTRIHGNANGSVDRYHNEYGSPFVQPNEALEEYLAWKMKQNCYSLDHARAEISLRAMIEVAEHRGWNICAAHIRKNHVHIVIQANAEPEKIIGDMKSYSSRALTNAGFENSERRRWTRGGSARYLWSTPDIASAIDYVLNRQGKQMVVFENAKWRDVVSK